MFKSLHCNERFRLDATCSDSSRHFAVLSKLWDRQMQWISHNFWHTLLQSIILLFFHSHDSIIMPPRFARQLEPIGSALTVPVLIPSQRTVWQVCHFTILSLSKFSRTTGNENKLIILNQSQECNLHIPLHLKSGWLIYWVDSRWFNSLFVSLQTNKMAVLHTCRIYADLVAQNNTAHLGYPDGLPRTAKFKTAGNVPSDIFAQYRHLVIWN